MTDTLRLISENVAKMVGGSYITERYYDKLHPKPIDNRSGAEIVADVVKETGITITKDSANP